LPTIAKAATMIHFILGRIRRQRPSIARGERMELIRPLVFVLSILAAMICALPWFALGAYISRWQMRWTVVDLQNRLLAWASENGYSIFHLKH
jgi:hypothetical protein